MGKAKAHAAAALGEEEEEADSAEVGKVEASAEALSPCILAFSSNAPLFLFFSCLITSMAKERAS